jgi:hypothetical protein
VTTSDILVMAPVKGPLDDREQGEFDHINLDTLSTWTDVAKLHRLEAYMRYELPRSKRLMKPGGGTTDVC